MSTKMKNGKSNTTKTSKKVETEDDVDYSAKSISELDHLGSKAMWGGSSKKVVAREINSFTINSVEKTLAIKTCKVNLIDALVKCYDELIVNAVDHVAYCRDLPRAQHVTKIDITFDKDTNKFTISNNGRGISIKKFPPGDINEGLWKPFVYFSKGGQGSNSFKDSQCIKAGVNGYGVKLVLSHAAEMVVHCGSKADGKTYKHIHVNDPVTGDYIIGKPKVTEMVTDDFVYVSFTPITEGPKKSPTYISGLDIDTWITKRLVYIMSYVHTLRNTFPKLSPVVMTYNGIDLSWITMTSIAEAFKKPGTEIVSCVIKPTEKEVTDPEGTYHLCPMELIFCMRDPQYSEKVVSNTNGTLIAAGAHLKPLMKQILGNLADILAKRIDNDEVKISAKGIKSMSLLLINAILPGLEFGEQSKTNALVSNAICSQYQLSQTTLNEIADLAIGKVIETSLDNVNKALRSRIKASDKFTDACHGSRNRNDFVLIIAEGDSALGSIRSNISSLDSKFNIDKIGFMTLSGGVPNVRKKCIKLIEDGREERIVVDNSTMNNVFMNTLQKALGVFVGSKADKSELRYSKIICCVDQDHDGKGKLFGLVMNIIAYFWPELLKDGSFLHKLDTPIKRVYSGSNKLVAEFYYDHEFTDWSAKNKISSKHSVSYYKGLASHEKFEMRIICKNIFDNIKGYKLDPLGRKLIVDYYDEDSNARKELLGHPTSFADTYYLKTAGKKIVDVSDFLNSDLFLFEKDDILRKLCNAVDGLNSSGRKIVNGILTKMRKREKEKVASIAASITKSQNYHHGEVCLEANIKHKCFINVGGRQLPLLLPKGNFGSRLCGGADAGSSRYIFAVHNMELTKLLYPEEDYGLLSFTPEDGECYEPDYFVPIVPMAILEHANMPSHGWNFKIIARDIFAVIGTVRQLIVDPTYEPIGPVPMALHGYTGSYVYDFSSSVEHTRGRYEIFDDRIVISEIPFLVWIDKYVLELSAKIVFYGIDAKIGTPKIAPDNKFTLCIMLGPNFWQKISTAGEVHMSKISKKDTEEVFGKDTKVSKKTTKKSSAAKSAKKSAKKSSGPIAKNIDLINTDKRELPVGQHYSLESFLNIEKTYRSALNLVSPDHSVVTFNNYFSIIKFWFEYRRALYIERVDRKIILMALEIEFLSDKIKFIEYCQYIKDEKIDALCERIKRMSLRAFNHVLLSSPGNTRTEDLRRLIMGDSIDEENKITYDYALNVRVIDRTKENVKKLKKTYNNKIIEFMHYKAKASYGQFRGSMIWLDELENLEAVVRKGIDTNWGVINEL